MGTNPASLRLGTRGSLLARAQSQLIADELMRLHAGLRVELVIVKTTGDRIQDKPLADAGGKGLFTKELEQALLAQQIDFAVHSYKDVPVTMPLVDQAGLIIAAVPQREDPSDALVCESARSIDELPANARIGTGSLRRQAQLIELRSRTDMKADIKGSLPISSALPDLVIQNIRGNIDTRIRKMRSGECDAVILAVAGLRRCGLFDPAIMSPLPLMLPAAGQGALAIQCRRESEVVRALLAAIEHAQSRQAVDAERAIVAGLDGDCHSPIAALATIDAGKFHLRVAVAARGGRLPVIRAESTVSADRSDEAIKAVLRQLADQNVHKLLHGND